jgi:FkbM family methyltransferase
MNLLQRLLNSESPKLRRPFWSLIGHLLQRSGMFEGLFIRRPGYLLPFFAGSNSALTYFVFPDEFNATEKFVSGFLKQSNIFVDVGANIGNVAVTASLAVGPEGRVFALEPHPRTFGYLLRTIEVNYCGNTSCHNVAAGYRTGRSGFTDEPRKDDNNRIGHGPLSVSTVSLPDFIRENSIERIDLLKVDVEGFEHAVISGLAGQEELVRCIYIESIDRNLRRYGSSEAELLDLLNKLGYSVTKAHGDEDNLICVRDIDGVGAS